MKSILILIVLFVVSFSASAAPFFVEPYLGYGFADCQQDVEKPEAGASTPEDTWFEMKGFIYGAKAGINMGSIYWGADLMMSSFSGEGQGYNGIDDSDIERKFSFMQLSGILGYQPSAIPLRLWLGYGFLNKLSDSGDHNQDGTFSGNMGYKFGVGIIMGPQWNLNLEYVYAKMDIDEEGTSPSTNEYNEAYFEYYKEQEVKALVLSLSFRFDS